ncbi:MAG: cupredoxin domain-containing protein [Coriobacteriia bacterium]|nr:cupredoxin domain-containing protein [Coriobacteriia bacterium]
MSKHRNHSQHTNDITKIPAKSTAHAPSGHSSASKPQSLTESSDSAVAAAVKPNTNVRMVLMFVLVFAAFFGAYRFAQAVGSATADQTTGVIGAVAQASSAIGSATGSGGGGGCCAGGSGAPIEGAATVEGGVQKISVDLSSGSYNPNVIKLKAGVPTEITFGQSSGCTAEVVSSDLGFQEDLTGGPKVVKLQGLAAGTYNFACSMNMVTGQIVVE